MDKQHPKTTRENQINLIIMPKFLRISNFCSIFAPNLGAYGKEERNSENGIGINPTVGEHREPHSRNPWQASYA
jgi:hypothetical protein